MFHVNNLPHVERPATLVTANPSEQFTYVLVRKSFVTRRLSLSDNLFVFRCVSDISPAAVENCPVSSGHLEFVCFYFEPL